MPRKLAKIETAPNMTAERREKPTGDMGTDRVTVGEVLEARQRIKNNTVVETRKKLDQMDSDEDLVTIEALRETRALLKKDSKSSSERISETNVEADFFGESSPDRTAAKILKESVAQQKREDEAQATMKEIAKATNFTEKEIGDWLEQQAIDKAAAEPENWRTRFAKSVKTIAGKLVGKDVSKLEAYKEEYLAAQALVNVSKNKAVEKMQDTPGSRPSLGGNRLISRGEAQKSSFSTKNPEVTASKEEESNPGGTANALLEKYRVAIGKGRTVSKEGVLTYEDQGTEELSVADLVKNQTLLKQAFEQILTKNKKDANALVDAIAEIRNENNGSALATEDISKGRGVAAGRKQAAMGLGGIKVTGAGAGASVIDGGLSERLQTFDTKKAKAEFANEAAAGITLDMALAKTKEDNERKQLNLEMAWLAAFSPKDARTAYKLMVPEVSAKELSVINGAKVAETYALLKKNNKNLDALKSFAATVTNEEALNKKAEEEKEAKNKDFLKTLEDSIPGAAKAGDAMRRRKGAYLEQALADSIPGATLAGERMRNERAKMAEVSAIGRKKMEAIAAEDRAEFLDDKDIELIEEEPAQPVKRKAPPKVSVAAKAVGRKKN